MNRIKKQSANRGRLYSKQITFRQSGTRSIRLRPRPAGVIEREDAELTKRMQKETAEAGFYKPGTRRPIVPACILTIGEF